MQPNHQHAGIAHFDIAGPNSDSLQKFYGEIFGWSIDSKGPGYSLVGTPDGGPNGAIMEAETPSLVIGITVEDIEAALSKVEASGGSIIMPATDNGWVKKAQISDVAGNRLTLIQI